MHRTRLKGAAAAKPYWAHDMLALLRGSAMVIDGKVYLGDEDGDVVVLEAPKKKLLFESNMGSHYLSDPEMTADTAAKYSVWVRDLLHAVRDASGALSRVGMIALVDAVEDVQGRNFYSGTGYGTCYGTRQAMDIVRNVVSEQAQLGDDELVVPYIADLRELYVLRSHHRPMPFGSYLEDEDGDGGWPFHTIRYMNEPIRSADGPVRKAGSLREVMGKAHNYE